MCLRSGLLALWSCIFSKQWWNHFVRRRHVRFALLIVQCNVSHYESHMYPLVRYVPGYLSTNAQWSNKMYCTMTVFLQVQATTWKTRRHGHVLCPVLAVRLFESTDWTWTQNFPQNDLNSQPKPSLLSTRNLIFLEQKSPNNQMFYFNQIIKLVAPEVVGVRTSQSFHTQKRSANLYSCWTQTEARNRNKASVDYFSNNRIQWKLLNSIPIRSTKGYRH